MEGSRIKVELYLDPAVEKAMAPQSSTLAWKIPWTEEPGRLRSMGSLYVAFSDGLLSLSNMHLRFLYAFPWLDN